MDELLAFIKSFVIDAPQPVIERVASACEQSSEWDSLLIHPILGWYSASLNQQFLRLITQAQIYQYSPSHLALALRSAQEVAKTYRTHQSIEMIWTGPEISPFALRRTDEALLEIIDRAEFSLMIVSFAIYKIDRIFEALNRALARQVHIQFFLETDPDKIQGGSQAVIQTLPPAITVYTWSHDHRPHTQTGNYGALHAKLAIADQSTLFLSSANFTEYALSLNMELGLMVTGGTLPPKAYQLLQALVSQGVFVEKPMTH